MQGGDLSNQGAPRIVFVFESTIGVLDPKAGKRRQRHLRFHQWDKAARCWTLDPHTFKWMTDVAWRTNYNIDLATYLDEEEAEHLREILDEQGVPFGHFYITTVVDMARVIGNYPNVAAIFDGDPSRALTYGGKGRSTVAL